MKKHSKGSGVILFENEPVRREFYKGECYFSVIDIIKILTQTERPRKYWDDLKRKLINEGSEVSEKIGRLKMTAPDGKKRDTDVANRETVLRLIQSIPSPKAEPFKLWLAQLGRERIEEIQDPELAIARAEETYRKKGYPDSWIEKRLRSIHIRNTLTDEWKNRGVRAGSEFAILTDEIYKGTFDMSARDYKDFKSLEKENNLRDHMNDFELILTMLGEATTTGITKKQNSQGFPKLKTDAATGGAVAGRTRKDVEKAIGESVLDTDNFLSKGDEEETDDLAKKIAETIARQGKPPLQVNPKSHHYAE